MELFLPPKCDFLSIRYQGHSTCAAPLILKAKRFEISSRRLFFPARHSQQWWPWNTWRTRKWFSFRCLLVLVPHRDLFGRRCSSQNVCLERFVDRHSDVNNLASCRAIFKKYIFSNLSGLAILRLAGSCLLVDNSDTSKWLLDYVHQWK